MPHLGEGRTFAPTTKISLGTLTTMSDVDSPVLRLIPYLAAFTVTIFATLSVMNRDGNLLVILLVAVVSYFGTYYLVQLVIGLIVRTLGKNTDDRG